MMLGTMPVSARWQRWLGDDVGGAAWDDPAWQRIPALPIAHFHPQSGPHRPVAHARLAWTPTHLHATFRVVDVDPIATVAAVNGAVCRDSCVEWFVQPPGDTGYLNIEINATGVLHASWIADARQVAGRFVDCRPLPVAELARVTVVPSLGRTVPLPPLGEVTWTVAVAFPLALLRPFTIHASNFAQPWRANCYQCADGRAQPYWAAWAPIGPRLQFHAPEYFGTLQPDVDPNASMIA